MMNEPTGDARGGIMEKWTLRPARRKAAGVAHLLVMVMLTAGSLLIVASLNYATTGVQVALRDALAEANKG